MPPRRSARVAAAAELRSCAFPQLPLSVELLIFSFLPVDQRLRCAEVSRGWRATVAQPALWRRVDMSHTSGVTRVTDALLGAVVSRAGSALAVLDLSETYLSRESVLLALHAAAAAGNVVQELHVPSREYLYVPDVNSVLAAAPELRELHANVRCQPPDADVLLEGRPPFAPLRLRRFSLFPSWGLPSERLLLPSALADARVQPGISGLSLLGFNLDAQGMMETFADAVCARPRLQSLRFTGCDFSSPAYPGLARILGDGGIADLRLENLDPDDAMASVICDGLRASSSVLTKLLLGSAHVSAPLLRALVAHQSLCYLTLHASHPENVAEIGEALAALIAADAAALKALDLQSCVLNANGLGPLFDALPRNSHLRTLECSLGGGNLYFSTEFTHERMLPAVRANTSLRTLEIHGYIDEAVDEAMRIVAAR